MVNDGGGARKEALQEERMLYVWDREKEGAPWRRGSVSAVCFKHKCFALSGTTDTPSEAVQDFAGCLCVLCFFAHPAGLSSDGDPLEEIAVCAKRAHTRSRSHVYLKRMEGAAGQRRTQVDSGFTSRNL